MKHAEKSALKIASRDKSTRDLQIKMNYHSATSRSIARSLPGINIDHGGTSLATPGLRDSKLEIRVSIFLLHSKACAIETSANPPCYTGKRGRRRREKDRERKRENREIRIGNDKSRGVEVQNGREGRSLKNSSKKIAIGSSGSRQVEREKRASTRSIDARLDESDCWDGEQPPKRFPRASG